MANEFTPAFRATSGLDAAGEKVINVAKADFNTLSDGVNVEFFIEENTLQQHDATRAYKKDFAVIYDNRIWVANNDVPVGPFAAVQWRAVRTDPKWEAITDPVKALKSGDYVTVNSQVLACTLTLPGVLNTGGVRTGPQEGDTIVVKDLGGNAGYNQMKVQRTAGLNQIVQYGQQVNEVLLTKPFSYTLFIFSNSLWQMYQTVGDERGQLVTSAAEHRCQPGEMITRRYTNANPVRLVLPTYANHGDMIRTVDIDGRGPLNHLIVRTVDPATSVGVIGTTQREFRTSGEGIFIYNKPDKLWVVWDGDLRTRLQVVMSDITLGPNSSAVVMGDNNSTSQVININFPTGVANGDTVKIALNYMRKKQTVHLVAAGTDLFLTELKLLQFPKRSEYPPDATWATEPKLTFNGDVNYTPVIEFSYIEHQGKSYWVVGQNVPTIERVDSLSDVTRKRVGVISLASQNEANVDHENNPVKEAAITPETLANRVAKENQRGIARIATTAQVNQITEFAFVDDVIVTPKKLNERQASEVMRGVAEVATQTETNAGTDDLRIVTPKKLNDRKASETLTGIAKLVTTTGTLPAASRVVMGTNVYDKTDNEKIVTPKSLSQLKATTFDQGVVYLATEIEVKNGVTQAEFENGVVTPETLHKRVATDTNHGLIEIATQGETDAGTDYTRAVTPKTLNDRKAREDLTGIARIATQPEFDAGVLDNVISTPLKVKTRFNSTDRTSVIPASGLVETGTLWDHYTLDIKEANETQRGTLKLATQALTDVGTDDKTAVTPLKLQKKKATETAEGIIQIATQAEVNAGTEGLKAVPPVHLKHIAQVSADWQATEGRRGFVRLSQGPNTFKGNATDGSGRLLPGNLINEPALAGLLKEGYTVSPYELNRTLQYFLPANAKAVDTDKLDGLDSLQFVRSDVDQTVKGIISFEKQINLAAPLVSQSTGSFTGDLSSATLTTKGPITLQKGANVWKMNVLETDTKLTIGDGTNDILILNTSTGNAAVKNNISAGADVLAKRYMIGDKVVAEQAGGKMVFGNTAQSASIKAASASLTVNDGAQEYKVLTEKNMVDLVGTGFVKKIGDTMSGDLTVNASVKAIRMAPATVDAAPTAQTVGFWSADISVRALYEKFPGVWTRLPNGERDQEVKSPGTLTQFGNTIETTYQDWVTHPTGVDTGTARYTRTWQANTNSWSAWHMVYTDMNRPSASEVGAVPSTDASFQNLTVREWLQIGQVRIEPDPVTRAVKFTWVDIP